MTEIRLMLIDDNPLICDSLAALIEKQSPGFKVCGKVMNRSDAMTRVRQEKPDFCLVDISLNGQEGGLELMKEIKTEFPEIRVLAVSLHDEALYAVRALNAGADGYLSKAEISSRLEEAVARIRSGFLFVSGSNGDEIIEQYHRSIDYTARKP